MPLTLYNTLTHSKEVFSPKPGEKIRLYSCGPTVYNYAHIGNLRSFICADLLYRTLKANNHDVEWVMNITDVDDKTIKATIAEQGSVATPQDLYNFTEHYYQAFRGDLEKVGVSVESIHFIRVTDEMEAIKEFIKELLKLGFAYKADDGSTYFNIQKYQEVYGDYGALMGEKFLEGKKVNARIANDEYHKDDLSDFALWKAHSPDDAQIFWEDETLGKGRPGWHIECSAVNWRAFEGKTTTIHTGGVDLRFPHHTNEIAQSTPLYAPEPFVNYWFHSEHLLVDGKKMSKSLGNFYTLRDLEEKGFDGLDFRNFVLDADYKKQQNFNFPILAQTQVAHIYRDAAFNQKKPVQEYYGYPFEHEPQRAQIILESFNNDLDTHQALADFRLLLRSDSHINSSDLRNLDKMFGLQIERGMENFKDTPLTIVFEEKTQKILESRDAARAAKNWPESDRLRQELESQGYIVEDSPEGTKLRKK
jgi:cysteinyl-tRNA synthetase